MTESEVKNEIKVSEKAAKQILKIMAENNVTTVSGLRVGVKGGGCSGLSYSMGFEPEPRDGDTIIDENGVRLFIDGKSLFYLTGTELDFSDGLNGRGFVFNNPNAVKTCGCGSSFGV
ncbi:MAG: iron-sulfur cluster assembly accessory protein [Ignavibacteriales bacterium]|nr:iron-sulfur cluster assembly accessory protein [Ignavibacteriales bacterium]